MLIRRVLPLAFLVGGLAGPLAAQAGQGTFTTVTISADDTVLPDSTVQTLQHYRQITLANTPTFPLHNTKGDCVGQFRVAKGAAVAGSGSCFVQAMDGQNGFTLWWEMTGAATTACPDLCGSWGVFGGYGRFAGLAGGGNWTRNGQFSDGSASGTWTGTLTKK